MPEKSLRGEESTKYRKFLSKREQECLRELCLGKSNKNIAEALGISTNTVKVYLWELGSKFGGKMSRVALAIWYDRISRSTPENGGACAKCGEPGKRFMTCGSNPSDSFLGYLCEEHFSDFREFRLSAEELRLTRGEGTKEEER